MVGRGGFACLATYNLCHSFTPLTLAQKPHKKGGLLSDKLCYKVNMECVAHGLPSVDDIIQSLPMPISTVPSKLQTWHIYVPELHSSE